MTSTDLRSTQERILDSAEQLFGQRGYHGTSIRDIASDSGTALNLVRYHFGSKDDLFRTVTGRRANAMNEALLQSLQAAQAKQASKPLTVAKIVQAYVSAHSRLKSEHPGWRNYLKLIIQCDTLVDRPELLLPLREGYQPVFDAYVAAYEAVGMNYENACWSVQFMHTSMGQLAADIYSISHLSQGVCDITASDTVLPRLTTFTAAGIRALMTTQDR